MNEWKDIEITGIDEVLSGYSDDGKTFTIVANLSRFPPEEWRDSYPSHWRDFCAKHDSLQKFGEPEILWSSKLGCLIKVVSPVGDSSVKDCIRLIQAVISCANNAYRPTAEKLEHRRINQPAYIARLNEWIADQKQAGWPAW